MLRTIIAEDHTILREGLRMLLEQEPDLEVVGEAGRGREALELIEKLEPDIAVLDLMLPEMHGLTITEEIKQKGLATRVIMLSMFGNPSYVAHALRAGARGYVLKGADAAQLIQAIRRVVAGKVYLSPPLDERTIAEYNDITQTQHLDIYELLTKREREVFSLAAHGVSNIEIGRRLQISARTVEIHRANVMRKLDLNSQSDLIRYAVSRGTLLPEAPHQCPHPPAN